MALFQALPFFWSTALRNASACCSKGLILGGSRLDDVSAPTSNFGCSRANKCSYKKANMQLEPNTKQEAQPNSLNKYYKLPGVKVIPLWVVLLPL